MKPRTQFASGDDYAVKRDKADKPKSSSGGPTLCPTWDEMAKRHYAKAAYYENQAFAAPDGATADEHHKAAKAHRKVADGLAAEAARILRLKRGM